MGKGIAHFCHAGLDPASRYSEKQVAVHIFWGKAAGNMKSISRLLNIIIIICCLVLAASYFLPTESTWSPFDAWHGYYDSAGEFVSGWNVGLVEVFPYAAGLIILLVLALSRWPIVGAILIMSFSVVWFASVLYEVVGATNFSSARFASFWPILIVLIAVPMLALGILVLFKFRTQARLLTLATLLAIVAIIQQAYSIAWYLLEDRLLLNIGSVTGVVAAAIISVSLLVQRQICVLSEKAEATQKQDAGK